MNTLKMYSQSEHYILQILIGIPPLIMLKAHDSYILCHILHIRFHLQTEQ